jgi:3-dehydroquinate synthase
MMRPTVTDTERLDIPFGTTYQYRLRFGTDVLGANREVLADVLEPSEGRPARVQFWVDGRVAAARPDLTRRIRDFASAYPNRISPAGELEVVPGGEIVKNEIHLLEYILKSLNAAELDRHGYVVVIGGGAVLDAVGFAASIAHRGLRLVRLPTTTLAQADSGIGVKNGVNLFGKKNWVGTFGVPWAVINDSVMLETLTDRDFMCGFAEAVKVSLLKDPGVFDTLCATASRIARREMDAALPMIRASAVMHLDHITRGGDPFETREARPLDFGHWSAHKLEAMSDFRLRHGEAVAIGVAIDSVYSSLALGLPGSDSARVLTCLLDLGFSLDDATLDNEEVLFAGLEEFRQHLGGRLTLTLLQQVGRPIDMHEVDVPLMKKAIAHVRARGRKAAPHSRMRDLTHAARYDRMP